MRQWITVRVILFLLLTPSTANAVKSTRVYGIKFHPSTVPTVGAVDAGIDYDATAGFQVFKSTGTVGVLGSSSSGISGLSPILPTWTVNGLNLTPVTSCESTPGKAALWRRASDGQILLRPPTGSDVPFGYGTTPRSPGNNLARTVVGCIEFIALPRPPFRTGEAGLWTYSTDGMLRGRTTAGIDLVGGCYPECNYAPCGTFAHCFPPDSDGDGLSNAWETPHLWSDGTTVPGIDNNCDGVYDASSDLKLVGANISIPDIYIQTDSMVQDPGTGAACANDTTCQSLPACLRPLCDIGVTNKCWNGVSRFGLTQKCTTNLQCQLLCAKPFCDTTVNHSCSEDPATGHRAPQESFDDMIASFHDNGGGIVMHIDVTNNAVQHFASVGLFNACGPLVSDFKALYFNPNRRLAYHYMLSGHAQCDTPGSSGIADLPGNDMLISLGTTQNGLPGNPGVILYGGTMMHEFGHNINLSDSPSPANPLSLNAPEYISVINFRYQLAGIPVAATVGSTVIDHYRIDYGHHAFDLLNEQDLNEPLGISISGVNGIPAPYSTDIVTFACPLVLCNPITGVGCTNVGPGVGGIDWDCDGMPTNLHAVSPLTGDGDDTHILTGVDDWSVIQIPFQCAPDSMGDPGAPLPKMLKRKAVKRIPLRRVQCAPLP